jgi:hypothetical protein
MRKVDKGERQNEEDGIRTKKWAINKRDIITINYNEFTNFINGIQFDKLNVV